MKHKNKIGNISALAALLFAVLIMLFQYFYIGFVLKKNAENESGIIAAQTAQEISKSIEVYFHDALTIAETYSGNFMICKQNNLPQATLYDLLKGSLSMNVNFLAVWTMFEPTTYENYSQNSKFKKGKEKGNFGISYITNNNGNGKIIQDTMAYYQNYYVIPKKSRKPIILDPYYYSYNGNEKKYFETSLISPVFDRNQFIGVIGIDIDLHELQLKYNKKKTYNDGFVSIISNSGEVVTHIDTSFIEKNISEFTRNENISINDSIRKGIEFITESVSQFTGEMAIRYYYPINFEYMASPWYIMIEMPQQKILQKAKSIKNFSLILLSASLFLLLYLIYNIADRRIKEKKLLDNILKLQETEQKLREYQDHLEDIVSERTNEAHRLNEELMTSNGGLHSVNRQLIIQKDELTLTLRQLKDAQSNLVVSEKMASLGRMASGIAHEINNPLNFIMGGIIGLETYFKENLKEHTENVSSLIDAINTGVVRAANIVVSLDHYCRKDYKINSNCDIHFIIDNCILMLDNQLRENVTIIREYSEISGKVTGSEGKLHQAFLNILSNACQSIESSGTIKIKTEQTDGSVFIQIEDTGCGISSANLDKIFDPFFTTKGSGKGTGLGLSITYNIIQEHKGTIEISSTSGEGTSVRICLPINK